MSFFDCYVTSCLCVGSLHDFTRLQEPDLIQHTGIQGSLRSDLSRKKEGTYILNVKSVQRSRYLVHEATLLNLQQITILKIVVGIFFAPMKEASVGISSKLPIFAKIVF